MAARQEGSTVDVHGIALPATPFRRAVRVPWDAVVGLEEGEAVLLHRGREGDVNRLRLPSGLVRCGADAWRERLVQHVERDGKLERELRRAPRAPALAVAATFAALGLVLGGSLFEHRDVVREHPWHVLPLVLGAAAMMGTALAFAIAAARQGAAADVTAYRIDRGGLSLQDVRGTWRRVPLQQDDRVGQDRARWGGRDVHALFLGSGLVGVPKLLLLALVQGTRNEGVPVDAHRSGLRCLLVWLPLTLVAIVAWAPLIDLDARGLRLVLGVSSVTWLWMGGMLLTFGVVARKEWRRQVGEAAALRARLGW